MQALPNDHAAVAEDAMVSEMKKQFSQEKNHRNPKDVFKIELKGAGRCAPVHGGLSKSSSCGNQMQHRRKG